MSFPENTDNPFKTFGIWFEEYKTIQDKDPNAMTVATVSKEGVPSSRVVLLKDFDEQGFVFYTNYTGRKSQDIEANPNVALSFYWKELDQQIRIEGKAEKVSAKESDIYFNSRDRKSQLGAWASDQSSVLNGGNARLIKEVGKYAGKFAGKDVPRPDHWGGWRVIPNKIEFWKQVEFRLHKRLVFTRDESNNTGWDAERLYP